MVQCRVKCTICENEFLIPEEHNLICECENISIYKDDLDYTCISVCNPESMEYTITEPTKDTEFEDAT